MAVDPTEPDTFGTDREDAGSDAEARGAETPEADAAEQRAEVLSPDEDEPVSVGQREADEADTVEQARSAGPDEDEDDYR
jgi:hypothetical protein